MSHFVDYCGAAYIANDIEQLINSPDGTANFYIGAPNQAHPVSLANRIAYFGVSTGNPFAKVGKNYQITIGDPSVVPTNTLATPNLNCFDNGVKTANATISFNLNSCQKVETSTASLTYTLATTGVAANTIVTLDSVMQATVAHPTLATSTGAFKWAAGTAPTLSSTSGYEDIIRLKYDGTNWEEISRAVGDH